MTLSSDNLNLLNIPDRFQPSFFLFPVQNDRSGYQPWAIPTVLVVPTRHDIETGAELPNSLPYNLRYTIEDVPQQAKVAGFEHRGILVPQFQRYTQELSLSELMSRRIDITGLSYFRKIGDTFEEIEFSEIVDGDYFEYTISTNVRSKILYYPFTDYFDLSDVSIATSDLPEDRYRFIWSADYYKRLVQDSDFICITSDVQLATIEMTVACPGEIHNMMVNRTPSVYFDENNIENQAVVKAYRPFADALQDIFDEQSLLRKLNWIDEIPAQLIPYLAYLLGVDLPNFPGVADEVKKSITKNGFILQKYKGSKLAIKELFEILGFTVDIINTWFKSDGSGFVAPGEQLQDNKQQDEIGLENVCQYDLLLNNYLEPGFGEIIVPLLYSPTSNITLHAYLVNSTSDSYNSLVNITNNLTQNLEYLNQDACSTDNEGFFIPTSISDLLPEEVIDGFSQVVLNKDLGAIAEYSVNLSTINKFGVTIDNLNKISITFDGYQSFENTRLFVFAQYSRDKIILPEQLTNLRSNRFDLNITFKDGEIISSNLFDFLISFVIKSKAFHSLLRKITFNVNLNEVYQVTDFCVGGIHKQKPGVDAGEQQVPPAIIPSSITCLDQESRGFKDSDIEYRRKVLTGLEAEFEASKTTLTSENDCAVYSGQNRVEMLDIDVDQVEDTRETICDLTKNTKDYCYKGRVDQELSVERIIAISEYINSKPCHLGFGVGVYYLLPDGTKFDKLDLMLVSNLHKLIKDWKTSNNYQIYFLNQKIGQLLDVYNHPAIQRKSINIEAPFMHFPGHRFPSWSYITDDFTHPSYNAKPWDDMYSSGCGPCRGLSNLEENPLNAVLTIDTNGNEVLSFDTVALTYSGNGILSDVSLFGSHDSRDFQVTHSIYSTAETGPLSDSGIPIVEFDGITFTTDNSIVALKLFESWNADCTTDYIDGYPSDINEFEIDPDDFNFNSDGVDIDPSALDLPVSGSTGTDHRILLFKYGSGIICNSI